MLQLCDFGACVAHLNKDLIVAWKQPKKLTLISRGHILCKFNRLLIGWQIAQQLGLMMLVGGKGRLASFAESIENGGGGLICE